MFVIFSFEHSDIADCLRLIEDAVDSLVEIDREGLSAGRSQVVILGVTNAVVFLNCSSFANSVENDFGVILNEIWHVTLRILTPYSIRSIVTVLVYTVESFAVLV